MEDEFKHLTREDLIKLILAMEAEEGRAVPGWWVGWVLMGAGLFPWVLLAVWLTR